MRREGTILAALALALSSACATGSGTYGPGSAAEVAAVASGGHFRGVVFIVHGIFPDDYSSWVETLSQDLALRGCTGMGVDHLTIGPGFFWGYATDEIARRIDDAARVLRLAHARTGCKVALDFAGIGYSAGTEVLLKTSLLETRFDRVVFGGSPVFCASSDLARSVREHRIGVLTNFYSPLDGLTLPFLGGGVFGFHVDDADEDRVTNHCVWEFHGFFPYSGDRGLAVADEVALALGGQGEHTCTDDVHFRDVLAAIRGALGDRDKPIPTLPEVWPEDEPRR